MCTKGSKMAAYAVLLGLTGCMSDEKPETGGTVVGLLLPFTGSASATASNLERATLFAADRINDAGGIHGTKLRVVSRDTHSDFARGLEGAKELVAAGAVAVIGPESAEVAQEIRPLLDREKVLFLSPLVGAADDPGRKCDTPWFRLAPSAKSLGEALAKQAHLEVERVAVLYSTSPYDRALGGAAAMRFRSLGGEVALELELNPDAQSYASVISKAIDAGVSDVILAASPRAAAIFVNEYDALSNKKPHWFLSPLLKTELLVQNVAPQALEGAQGIAPGIYVTDEEFQTLFSERWEGDAPLEGAYFYYDAMGLLAITLAKVERDGELSLPEAMLDAAGPPGEYVHWDKLKDGVENQLKGDDLYYSGLTGPISLDPCGGRNTGITTNWTVQNGAIVNVNSK